MFKITKPPNGGKGCEEVNKLTWQDLVTIISGIIGTVSLIVGIISFVITIQTWKNTKNISKRVAALKIKEIYPEEHAKFVEIFNNSLVALSEGDRRYYIVTDLLKTCRKIQAFYDNWEPQYKKSIDKFTKELDKIPPNEEINEKIRIRLQKQIYELQPMMERIGKLDGIG